MPPRPTANQPLPPLRLTTEAEPRPTAPTPVAPEDLRPHEAVYREALAMTSRLLEMPDMFDLPW